MITALFSDDALYEKLVLKGGNALRLIYNFGSRSSLDIDVSIEEDFVDLEDTRTRLFRALETRFTLAGFYVLDLSLHSTAVDIGRGRSLGRLPAPVQAD